METVLAIRFKEQIPYLSKEAVLHRSIQRKSEDGSLEALLLGVPKDVLAEQMKLLRACGLVPDRVILSTDLLVWMYRAHMRGDDRRPDQANVLIHLFGNQAEMLFFENQVLLQSRWVSWETDQAANLLDAVQSYTDGFQREWRKRPNALFLIGERNEEAESSLLKSHFSVERISSDHETTLAPILAAAARAYATQDVFDFTLPEVKEVRNKERRVKGRAMLLFSIACFSFSLFFLAVVQTLMTVGEMGWLRFKMGALEGSVQEVREVRTKALHVQDFRAKKSLPVLLLGGLRKAVPHDLVFRELEYDEAKRRFSLQGTARAQAHVDQFIAAVGAQSIFERLALERIQTERAQDGSTVYSFTLEGNLNLGELP